MDLIGDCAEINSRNQILDENIDKFNAMLLSEEDRLHKLEDQRIKLEKDIETLAKEIADEKSKYRESIGILLQEREKISLKYLEDFHKAYPDDKVEIIKSPSNSSLMSEVKDAIESSTNLDFEIKIDTEKLRGELFAETDKKDSKEDYLIAMKQHLSTKHKQKKLI